MSASLTSDGRHRLHIQRECYRAYLDEEMSLQQKRREMHKSRPFRVWSSGEWCWFWRSRAHLHRRTKASRQFKEGAFLGRARVLLQERERKGDDLKYKAVVWLVDGDQLVRCSSTHLRPVSTAEQTLCLLRDGEARTFQQLVQELPKRNFVDLVGQPSPVEEDFEEPMNVASSDNELHEDFVSGDEFESAPVDSGVPKDPQVSYRTRSASSHADAPGTMSTEPTEAPFISKVEPSSSTARPPVAQTPTVPQSSTSQTSAVPPTASPSHVELSPEPMSQSRAMKRPLEQISQPESKRMSLGEDPSVEHGILAAEDLRWLPKQRSREVRYPQTCWNPDVAEKRKTVLTSCAQDEVVEVAFALAHHEAIKIAETPATALAALARQGRGEVRVSTLTPQEREELVKAKQKEISSFLKHAAVEAATRSGLQCKSLMRMRWVITRKSDDSLKARLVIQGFTDPQLGAKPTASPTVSRRGRQLFLTVAGSLGMKVFKGDAKTAFLQGSVGDQELHCEPIAELAQALGLEHHQCVRLRKSVYGLIDAPRAWWERVETDMNKLKWRTLTTEPCFWVMTSVSGRIEGLAVAYVDDFMVAIYEESPVSQKHFSEVKALYEWGEWESGSFTQCGVQIVQHRHQNRWAGFSLSCAQYAESMVLLDLSSARRKQRDDPVTAKQLAGLRGLLGQLMWLATQVVPQLQAPLSLLLGYLGVVTVSTLLEANKLARRALVWAQTPLRTFVHDEMSVVGWSDASWACRREGSSQGGYIIGVANKTFLEQAESPISVISWHSGKLARVARSSNSAELQAAADAEGELSYIRLSLRELVGETIPLQRWQEAAAQIPSVLVLDSRGVYDALARSESACLGLKDKRSGLEALSLKRSLVETRCGLRWTNSAAQLADCMTKGSEEAQKPFELLKRRGWKWRLVYDPSFTSARKRAQKGHDVLDYLPSSRTEEEFLTQ